jgi:hypothetical protein
MEEIMQMDAMDFLNKILWDLSNVDESISLHPQLAGIRREIAEFLGIVDDNQEIHEHYDEYDYPSCQYCGDGDMDPMTECPQCS